MFPLTSGCYSPFCTWYTSASRRVLSPIPISRLFYYAIAQTTSVLKFRTQGLSRHTVSVSQRNSQTNTRTSDILFCHQISPFPPFFPFLATNRTGTGIWVHSMFAFIPPKLSLVHRPLNSHLSPNPLAGLTPLCLDGAML